MSKLSDFSNLIRKQAQSSYLVTSFTSYLSTKNVENKRIRSLENAKSKRR